MATTYNRVCQIALSFPGVSEGRSYGGPSLHVGRKFLGRLRDEGETLVLKVSLPERARIMRENPDAFFITDHYRPHPFVLVNLLAADEAVLHALIEAAWRMLASQRAIAAHDRSSKPEP